MTSLSFLNLLTILAVFLLLTETLSAQELPRRVQIGLAMQPVENGVQITFAPEHQPAGMAGMLEGDIIRSIDGEPVTSQLDVIEKLRNERPPSLRFSVERNGREEVVTVHPQEVPLLDHPDFEFHYGVVETDDGTLRRTIIRKPHGDGPFPTIVMLGGIGCYSLDSREGVAYIDMLNELASTGYLTYWVEKSGMGDSQGTPCMEINFDTELSGYRAGLSQVRTMSDVDQNRVILLGHSMGGLTGPILASETDEPLHAIIAMSTFGVPWFEYLIANSRRQVHFSDLSLSEIENRMSETVKVHYMYTIEKKSPEEILKIFPDRAGSFNLPHHYSYFQQVADYKPLDLWSRTGEAQALLIAGGADYVVSIDEHKYVVDNLNNLRPGSAKFIFIEDMDHGLRFARDQQAARAGESGAFHSELVPAIINWLESIDD
ncbi:alpha/beta fold hydrolase [Rhodohalobacter sp. SW132]|uniref:alpha/beta fold hydrolase n=1 Tax=Rhodohalobacter sp. SW132 TaxID=2293433 RepID=UPI00131525DD|nr:alpha/beta fold hydrolase [Rhodohalobacter sp. SW132]